MRSDHRITLIKRKRAHDDFIRFFPLEPNLFTWAFHCIPWADLYTCIFQPNLPASCRATSKLRKLSLWMWLTGIGCTARDILSWRLWLCAVPVQRWGSGGLIHQARWFDFWCDSHAQGGIWAVRSIYGLPKTLWSHPVTFHLHITNARSYIYLPSFGNIPIWRKFPMYLMDNKQRQTSWEYSVKIVSATTLCH